ncbi:MAG: phosphohydrolase [Candidatus Omnitrophica bacterium]|nr:phosphohydrolase [Candidatus Omnitrophota bacterium]MDD5660586.1 phosphohydrolase [Candidatus Omnitrophota bacterium]
MIDKCPGQDFRKAGIENIICSKCAYAAEIFTDEIKVRCPKCNGLICRDKLPSCVDWCKAARNCIGEEKWKQLKGG